MHRTLTNPDRLNLRVASRARNPIVQINCQDSIDWQFLINIRSFTVANDMSFSEHAHFV